MDEKYTEEGLIIVSETVATTVIREIQERAGNSEGLENFMNEIEIRMQKENPALLGTLYSTLDTIVDNYEIEDGEHFGEIVRVGFLMNYEMVRSQAHANSLEKSFKKNYGGNAD